MTKKYKLTDEHRSQLVGWSTKWIANAMSTAAMTREDRAAVDDAVLGLYSAAALPAPRVVVFCASPIGGAIASGIAAGVWFLRDNPGRYQELFGRPVSESELMAAIQPAVEHSVRSGMRFLETLEAASASPASPHIIAVDDATSVATRDATYGATSVATRDATYGATYGATYVATRDSTNAAYAAINDATRAAANAAYAAINDATSVAARGATDDATSVAARGATDAAINDATRAAARGATRAATNATYVATDVATSVATRGATDDATDAATRAAAYDATDAATDAATYATRAATYAAAGDATYSAAVAAAGAATQSATNDAATRAALIRFLVQCENGAYWRMHNGGNLWSAWSSYISFFRRVAKLEIDYSKWDHWEVCATRSGPRYMHARFTIVCDRPETLRVDEQDRPHCSDGPSHRWRDGWEIYHWRGIRVPKAWIVDAAKMDPSIALTWPNIEQRRSAAEIIGWRRVLEQLSPKVINRDADPEIGELLEVELPDAGTARFLRVRCATGRDFVLSIPLEMKTALEANAWTYGIEPDELLALETRT